ncbi:MAG: hypothetical protein Ct9H300mP12_04750 [Acidimicrobiales bacterium]|nr:MAG: hypothetical protein Ct9H300mP12_04750 [Acidimicrobiales bacterium]
MLGLLGVLRSLGTDAPRMAAVRFGQVAWPCFALAVTTGIWGLAEVGLSNQSEGISPPCSSSCSSSDVGGGCRRAHRTRSPALRGVSGGIGFLAALGGPPGWSRTGYLNRESAGSTAVLWMKLWMSLDLSGEIIGTMVENPNSG